MKKFTPEEYRHFMAQEKNEYNCNECPENCGYSFSRPSVLPCGQYHCWVVLTVDAGREYDEK